MIDYELIKQYKENDSISFRIKLVTGNINKETIEELIRIEPNRSRKEYLVGLRDSIKEQTIRTVHSKKTIDKILKDMDESFFNEDSFKETFIEDNVFDKKIITDITDPKYISTEEEYQKEYSSKLNYEAKYKTMYKNVFNFIKINNKSLTFGINDSGKEFSINKDLSLIENSYYLSNLYLIYELNGFKSFESLKNYNIEKYLDYMEMLKRPSEIIEKMNQLTMELFRTDEELILDKEESIHILKEGLSSIEEKIKEAKRYKNI